MAVVQNPVIGQARNSAGGMIFQNWRGKKVMRARPITVSNPNTPAQQTQRNLMKTISLLGRQIISFIRLSFAEVAIGVTEYNVFVSRNINFVDPVTGGWLPGSTQDLWFSDGSLSSPINFSTTPVDATHFGFSKTADAVVGKDKNTDVIVVIVADLTDNTITVTETSLTRIQSGNASIPYDSTHTTFVHALYKSQKNLFSPNVWVRG